MAQHFVLEELILNTYHALGRRTPTNRLFSFMFGYHVRTYSEIVDDTISNYYSLHVTGKIDCQI